DGRMSMADAAPTPVSRPAWVFSTATLVLALLVWEAAVRFFNVPVYILPPPSAILHVAIVQHAYLFKNAVATSWAILLGFAYAFVVGIPIAALMVYSESFSKAIY